MLGHFGHTWKQFRCAEAWFECSLAPLSDPIQSHSICMPNKVRLKVNDRGRFVLYNLPGCFPLIRTENPLWPCQIFRNHLVQETFVVFVRWNLEDNCTIAMPLYLKGSNISHFLPSFCASRHAWCASMLFVWMCVCMHSPRTAIVFGWQFPVPVEK